MSDRSDHRTTPRKLGERPTLDRDLISYAESEIGRQIAQDAYRHQMRMIAFFASWDEEATQRHHRQEVERREYIERGSVAMRTVMQQYADTEMQISQQQRAGKIEARQAENHFRAMQAETGRHLDARRAKTNAAFEKTLSDREYRFEKKLQEDEEAFERAIDKKNSYPSPR